MRTKTYQSTSSELLTLSLAAALIILASFTTTVFAAASSPSDCPEQIAQSSKKIGSSNQLNDWMQSKTPAELEKAYDACKNKSEQLFKDWAELRTDLLSVKRNELSQENIGFYNFLISVGTKIGKIGTGQTDSPQCIANAVVGLAPAVAPRGSAVSAVHIGGPVEYRVLINNQRAGNFTGQSVDSPELQKVITDMKAKSFDCIIAF